MNRPRIEARQVPRQGGTNKGEIAEGGGLFLGITCALAGLVLGLATATVFAQFGNNTNGPAGAEAMNNAERRAALERCDGYLDGAMKDRCMDDLVINRNQVRRNESDASRAAGASRMGDGRTGAPGIGTGPSSVTPEASEPVRRDGRTAP